MVYLLFFIVSILADYELDHAIYLSTIKASHAEDRILLDIRVFEDDLRDALRSEDGRHPDTSSTAFFERLDEYLSEHISIHDGSQSLKVNLIGKKLIGDSYQLELVSEGVGKVENLTFEFNYFFELFPTQQNVLHFRKGEQQWYHIFKKGGKSWRMEL